MIEDVEIGARESRAAGVSTLERPGKDAGDPRGERRPTLAEVAQLAGVSLKTASRAVNGEKYVAVDTRERVLAAAAQLGFRINAMASLLKRGVTSNMVALITGDLGNPFYSVLAKGVESELRAHGLQLTIASSDERVEDEHNLIDEFVSRRVRALILVSTMDSHAALHTVQDRGISMIFVDRPPIGLDADSFVLDNYSGTRTAIEQLLAHGHRRIGYISDFSRLPTHRERARGFSDAMTAAGVPDWQRYVETGAHDGASAERLVTEMLKREAPPTAFFAGNNQLTIGAVKAITRHAPGTALIGFDDFELADVLGVTTVSHDPSEMGRLAARRVLQVDRHFDQQAEQHVLPTRIIARGSGERAPLVG